MQAQMRGRDLVRLALALALLTLTACAPPMTGAAPRFIYNPAAPSPSPARPQLALKAEDRVLILAPHPDDEVLAAGGVIQQAIARKIPVQVVFLTSGDNNEFAYLYFRKVFTLDSRSARDAGVTRGFEAIRAGRELGLGGGDEIFLGYPDFGTLEIWLNRWGDREAYRSMFTEANAVPYWFAQNPDSPYKGEAILADITEALREFKPTKVLVSHPADVNPDHAALYLFLRTALWEIGGPVEPEIHAYLTHYGDWPQPRGHLYDAPHEPPAKFDETGRWLIFPLTHEQVAQKEAALRRHKTQYEASRPYLESFMRRNELFDTPPDIVLERGAPDMEILPGGTGVAPGQALAGAWLDQITRQVRLEGNDLILTLRTAQPTANGLQAQTYLLGYRRDRPFAEMPKLYLEVNGATRKLSDRRQRLSSDRVSVNTTPATSEMRIPVALLGDPARVFLSTQIQAGGTATASPWVVIHLPAP